MCLTPQNVTKFGLGREGNGKGAKNWSMNNLILPDSFWEILSTNEDDDGLEFVSLIEAKRGLPIWGSQFHPEKNAFEWTTRRGHEVRHVQITCVLAA